MFPFCSYFKRNFYHTWQYKNEQMSSYDHGKKSAATKTKQNIKTNKNQNSITVKYIYFCIKQKKNRKPKHNKNKTNMM